MGGRQDVEATSAEAEDVVRGLFTDLANALFGDDAAAMESGAPAATSADGDGQARTPTPEPVLARPPPEQIDEMAGRLLALRGTDATTQDADVVRDLLMNLSDALYGPG